MAFEQNFKNFKRKGAHIKMFLINTTWIFKACKKITSSFNQRPLFTIFFWDCCDSVWSVLDKVKESKLSMSSSLLDNTWHLKLQKRYTFLILLLYKNYCTSHMVQWTDLLSIPAIQLYIKMCAINARRS